MAKSSSSHQVSNLVAKNSLSGKSSKDGLSKIPLDFVNLFNPPKSNPNGRLAASKLFHKDTSLRLASLSPKFQEKKPRYSKLWWISAISIILLVNVTSSIIILREKRTTEILDREIENNSEISAGKTNLAVEEFITPSLNSLSRISIASKNNNTIKSVVGSKVPSPLAIPPTNLPNQEITHSKTANTSYYYILAEYTGEESLKLAQKQAKNVSLVNFPQGIFIYLGAFSEKIWAQNFVNSVKKEGLDAYIYPLLK